MSEPCDPAAERAGAVGWTRHAARLREPLPLTVLVSALVLAFGTYAAWPRPGSVIVEASTQGLTLGLTALADPWRLPSGTVCVRRGRGETSGGTGNDAHCGDRRLYAAYRFDSAELIWPAGTELELTRTGAQDPLSIRIEILPTPTTLQMKWPEPAEPAEPVETAIDDRPGDIDRGQVALAAGDIVHLDEAGWSSGIVLPFSNAVAIIGLPPTAGSSGYLIAGRFQMREQLPGRDLSTTVREGEFLLGDQVGIVSRAAADHRSSAHTVSTDDARSFRLASGFITAPERRSFRGMQVLLSAPARDSALLIARQANDATVRATLWHRLASDSLVLSLAALLAFASAGAALLERICTPAGGRSDG